jgi:hypothetical protein
MNWSTTSDLVRKESIPIGARAQIYSYLPFSDLISSISRLSKTDRDYITHTDILDQPRRLKITIADLFENQNNLTQCHRYDSTLGQLVVHPQSPYKIDFPQLDYTIRLLRGDLTVKIEAFSERDYFLL